MIMDKSYSPYKNMQAPWYTARMSEIKWFFIILVIMFVFWSLTGGASRTENKTNPYIEQPSPIEGGKVYNGSELREKNPALFPGY